MAAWFMERASHRDDIDFHFRWPFGSFTKGGFGRKEDWRLVSQLGESSAEGGDGLGLERREGSNSSSALEANLVFKLNCCSS